MEILQCALRSQGDFIVDANMKSSSVMSMYIVFNSFYYISIHGNKCMGENLLNSGIAEACFYQSSYVLHFCSLRLTRRRHVNLFVQKPMIPKSPRISRN